MSPSSSSELKPQATMRKTIRIIIGIVAAGVVLHLADLATRDCRVAPYVYDDCMWMGLRARLGLPANRFLRMAALECVGILLALVLYVAFRFAFSFRKPKSPAPESPAPPVSDPPGK